MATVERLDEARAELFEAEGVDFLRRLADYATLIESDEAIDRIVAEIRREVEDADADLDRKDAEFFARLVPIRKHFAEREPEADDSNRPWPGPYDPFDGENARAFHDWTFTLANFDAIVQEREEQVNPERGGDHLNQSRTQKLVAILNAKLHDLVFPFNERPAPRPDLMNLYDEMNEIAHEQTNAYRGLERLAEDTGYLGLRWVEEVGRSLTPQDSRPLKTPEDKRRTLEEALMKPDLFRLFELLRPTEARGRLSDSEKERIVRLENLTRGELDRLHRPLRDRLQQAEEKRWTRRIPRLFGRLRIVPPLLGFFVDLVAAIGIVVLAAGVAGHFLHLW